MNDFENHGWKDVVDPEILGIYQSYHRKTFIGKKAALLLVDLYNLVYEGGPRPVREVFKEFPSSCGIHAWKAIEPTKELIALARTNSIPIFFSTRGIGHVQSTYR
jgi:maleamate amidohydrolase